MVEDALAGETALFTQQRREAQECKVFLESPVWHWLQAHLRRSQVRHIAAVSAMGLTPDERLIRLGKLALITEILERPEDLVRRLHHYERRDELTFPEMS